MFEKSSLCCANDNLNYLKSFNLLSTPIIYNSLSTAAKDVDLQLEGERVTNYSVVKTCILKLHAADLTETFLAQLSGDKSTDSQRVRNTKRGCPWPSVELLVLKPVWNNECQVATCSAAEIATATQKILWLTIFTTPYCLTPSTAFCRCKHRIYLWMHLPDISWRWKQNGSEWLISSLFRRHICNIVISVKHESQRIMAFLETLTFSFSFYSLRNCKCRYIEIQSWAIQNIHSIIFCIQFK